MKRILILILPLLVFGFQGEGLLGSQSSDDPYMALEKVYNELKKAISQGNEIKAAAEYKNMRALYSKYLHLPGQFDFFLTDVKDSLNLKDLIAKAEYNEFIENLKTNYEKLYKQMKEAIAKDDDTKGQSIFKQIQNNYSQDKKNKFDAIIAAQEKKLKFDLGQFVNKTYEDIIWDIKTELVNEAEARKKAKQQIKTGSDVKSDEEEKTKKENK